MGDNKDSKDDIQNEITVVTSNALEADDIITKISTDIARLPNAFTAKQLDLFLLTLSQIDNIQTLEPQGTKYVNLYKKDVFAILDYQNSSNPWQEVLDIWRRVIHNSDLSNFQKKVNQEMQEQTPAGVLITDVVPLKNVYAIFINGNYLSILKDMDRYTLLSLKDVKKLTTKHSKTMYIYFRSLEGFNKQCIDKENSIYTVLLSTKKIKELLNLSLESYTAYDSSTGNRKFQRTNFEKKIIEVFVKDINSMENGSIKNLKVEKEKQGNRIVGYRFTFKIDKLKYAVPSAPEIELEEIEKIKNEDTSLEGKKETKGVIDYSKYSNSQLLNLFATADDSEKKKILDEIGKRGND